ncbi:MAG: hypothetical protein R3F35_20335 [Myxococcota bacterium]
MMLRALVRIALSVGASGCGTLTTVLAPESRLVCDRSETLNRVYSGIFADIEIVQGGSEDASLGVLDFPFSLAADTAMLVYTVPMQLARGDRICGGNE